MAEFESRSVPDPVGTPTMTHGLNDMGLAPSAPEPAPAAPRRPTPVPIPQDVEALFVNPALADRFDRQWGEGAAKKLLDKVPAFEIHRRRRSARDRRRAGDR